MNAYIRRLTGRSQTLNWVLGIVVGFYVAQLLLFVFVSTTREAGELMQHLQFPVTLEGLLHQPWALVTYWVAHPIGQFLPFVMNCLFIFMFGSIFVGLLGENKFRSFVIFSLLINGVLTFLVAQLTVPEASAWDNPTPDILFYNSHFFGIASLMTSIIAAIITFTPKYPLRLVFLGNIPIIWVGLAIIVLRFVSFSSIKSIPEITALGVGVFVGLGHALLLKRGTDITTWTLFPWQGKQAKKPRLKVVRTPAKKTINPTTKKAQTAPDPEDELNRILDKINEVGYGGLTRAEKEFLEKASKE